MIKSDIGSYTQETRMAVLRSVRALMSEIPGAQPEPADQSGDESSQVLDEMLHRLASGEESAPEAPPETEKTQPRNLHTIMRYIEEMCIRDSAGAMQPGVILAFLTYFNMVMQAVMGINRIFMMLSKATAVSYTHLDVYKRQGSAR